LDDPFDLSAVADIYGEAEALRRHPEFDTALREYTLDLTQFRKRQRHLNKVIAQTQRFRIIGHLLHRHGVKWLEDNTGGVTYTELAQACTVFDSSPRNLKTMLGLMQVTGFVKVTRDPTDHRRKLYVPTDSLIRFVRGRVMCAATSLDILKPRLRCSQILREDPSAIVRVWATGGLEFALGPAMAKSMPVFFPYFRTREGGAPVTFAIMSAYFSGTECLSRARIAQQFGLSKTQVSLLMKDGAKLGLLTFDDKGTPLPSACMQDHYRQLLSLELAFFARHIRP
jgi:DNA-binding MarR family transcriptional regulator